MRRNQRLTSRTVRGARLLAALACTLASCGSGSSGGSGNPGGGGPTDGIAPTAEITFPSDGALTEGATVLVKGIAADVDGIAAVTVNGVAATTMDAFAHWIATVPLVHGENDIVVATRDAGGTSDPAADSVRVRREDFLPVTPQGAVLDIPGNRVLYLDSSLDALLSADLTSGERRLISGPEMGSGPALGRPRALVLDGAMNRVLVADPVTRSILGVNLASGNRSVVAGPFAAPFEPWRLAYDGAAARLYSTDDSAEVFVIDLGTNTKSAFSRSAAPEVGTGPELIDPRGIALDAPRGRLLVGDAATRRLVAAALANGDRTLLAADTGVDSAPYDVEVNAAGTLAYVIGRDGDRITEVDLTSGATRIVSGPGVGAGAPFDAVRDIMLDEANMRLVALDPVRGTFVFVAIGSGDRDTFSGAGRGEGPRPFHVTDIVLRPGTSELLVAEPVAGRIPRIDLVSGDRTEGILTVGGGEPDLRANDLKLDGTGTMLFAADRLNGRLFRVDIAAESRTVLSSDVVGMGAEIPSPLRLDHDPGNDLLYVLDDQRLAILTLETDTLQRKILSGDGQGGGPVITNPLAVAYDSVRDRGLFVDLFYDAVIGIRLLGGGRSIASSVDTPFEPPVLMADANTEYGPNADMELDASRERVLLATVSADGIAAVKSMALSNGALSLVSGGPVGGGVRLISADAVEVSADGQTIYVLDGARDAIAAIDAASGYRVLVSKR